MVSVTPWLCGLFLSVSLCLWGAGLAEAQSPLPAPSTATSTPDFLTHYNFHLSADALSSGDQRFSWQAHVGGDLDLVDYVAGRVNLLIDYEAVLGREFRRFDPNQGNYTLEGSASVRARHVEIAGVFHHVSRHLGDRPKPFAIAWNVMGVRVLRRLARAGTTVDLQGSAGRVVQRSFVDYTWTGDADVVMRRPLTPRVGVFAHGAGQLVGVDPAIAGRSLQRAGRLEAGVRLDGRASGLELFAGFERRSDADPIDRAPHRWAFAGFRFIGR
jgi:hypothetical protein